jgi:RNA polymerase sigma-70 factor (ECF subfamily)
MAARHLDFERLALPLAGALHRTARRFAAVPDDAADVTQEALLRAYRTFDNFREGTSPRAWLFAILFSILANRWRRARRFPLEVSLADADRGPALGSAASGRDVERLLLSRLDASTRVGAALRRLPEAFRAAVRLVDLEELTYDEAAAALGCPVGTVRSRVARGRRKLLATLREQSACANGVRPPDRRQTGRFRVAPSRSLTCDPVSSPSGRSTDPALV